MRVWVIAALVPTLANGQLPDVTVNGDIRGHFSLGGKQERSFRWYDPLGRHSVIGFSFGLEPGFRAWVSERLQKIPNSGDSEQLDEYYVEDPGIWRVGKQVLPFGRADLFREYARAVRGDTDLFIEGLPVVVAMADNGPRYTRGVVVRVGSRIGLSVAVGEHFGISATALSAVRDVEASPGEDNGHRLVIGIDGSRRFGNFEVSGEVVVLRRGHRLKDLDTEVSQLGLRFSVNKIWCLLSWARDWRGSADFFRLEGGVPVYKGVSVEPLIRVQRSGSATYGVSMRYQF